MDPETGTALAPAPAAAPAAAPTPAAPAAPTPPAAESAAAPVAAAAAAPAALAAAPAAAPAADPAKAGEKPTDAPTGAPETYAAFTMPEGYAVNDELLGEFSPVLKELNLTQDQAQKVMDFAPKLIETTQQATVAQVLDRVGLKDYPTWAAALKTDPEIGGEKHAENLGLAAKAVAQFGSPELATVLNKTGLGNHPALVRTFLRIGKAISEDGFVGGGGGSAVAAPSAKSMYPNSNMNP